eukprot:GCRY01003333.1.p1 GENE.GCRY01003333.1~~GCRY01003333.1.p1  ORF type:complete len:335 (-),score=51.35 GCRY01003333.1:98-1102(-)
MNHMDASKAAREEFNHHNFEGDDGWKQWVKNFELHGSPREVQLKEYILKQKYFRQHYNLNLVVEKQFPSYEEKIPSYESTSKPKPEAAPQPTPRDSAQASPRPSAAPHFSFKCLFGVWYSANLVLFLTSLFGFLGYFTMVWPSGLNWVYKLSFLTRLLNIYARAKQTGGIKFSIAFLQAQFLHDDIYYLLLSFSLIIKGTPNVFLLMALSGWALLEVVNYDTSFSTVLPSFLSTLFLKLTSRLKANRSEFVSFLAKQEVYSIFFSIIHLDVFSLMTIFLFLRGKYNLQNVYTIQAVSGVDSFFNGVTSHPRCPGFLHSIYLSVRGIISRFGVRP